MYPQHPTLRRNHQKPKTTKPKRMASSQQQTQSQSPATKKTICGDQFKNDNVPPPQQEVLPPLTTLFPETETPTQTHSSASSASSSASTCPICLDEISVEKKNYAITSCGHEFCFSCLNQSLIKNNKCPCCRAPIEEKKREITNKIDRENSLNLVKQVMEDFPLMTYVRPMDAFQEPTASPEQRCAYLHSHLKMILQSYSINLMEFVRTYQEIGDDLFDDGDDYEEDDEDEDDDIY